MKKYQLIFWMMLTAIGFFPCNALPQCNQFSAEYGKGMEKIYHRDYAGAFDNLVTAATLCPDSVRKCWALVPGLFRENNRLRYQAIQAKDSLEQLNGQLRRANHELDSTNSVIRLQRDSIEDKTKKLYSLQLQMYLEKEENRQKMEKLPFGPQRTIYLASEEKGGDRKYFYIDILGARKDYLGTWEVASQFEDDGYAYVKNDTSEFLLDSFGVTYPVFTRRRNGGLQKAWAINWNDEDLRRVPHKVKQMKYLHLLFLNKNRLGRLPKFLKDRSYLHELLIADNNFERLKPFLATDTALIKIDATGNHIQHLSSRICQLPRLKILLLGRNEFKNIPNGLAGSETLEVLDLSHNKIKTIPNDIYKMPHNLRVLDLCFNQLSAIPSDIARLNKLEILGLTGNEFSKFPDEIYEIESLQVLRIGDNPCSNKERERKKIREGVARHLPNCQVYFY